MQPMKSLSDFYVISFIAPSLSNHLTNVQGRPWGKPSKPPDLGNPPQLGQPKKKKFVSYV